MTDEEKKVINNLKYNLEIHHIDNTILFKMENLIEIKQAELEKKDKIISRLLDFIVENTDCPYESNGIDLDCEKRCESGIEKECWKKYFEKEE